MIQTVVLQQTKPHCLPKLFIEDLHKLVPPGVLHVGSLCSTLGCWDPLRWVARVLHTNNTITNGHTNLWVPPDSSGVRIFLARQYSRRNSCCLVWSGIDLVADVELTS